jgi:ADP-dependent glucokinase
MANKSKKKSKSSRAASPAAPPAAPPRRFPAAAAALALALILFRFSQPAPGAKVALLHELEAAGGGGGGGGGGRGRGPQGRKIALGWNTCVDMLVDLPSVARALDLAPRAARAGDHAKVRGASDLESTVAYWFSRGGAAERLVGTAGEEGEEEASAAAFFDGVVAAAGEVEGSRYRVGGNAALMATSLARLGCEVRLGGPIGDTLAGLLDPRIDTVSPTREDGGGSVTDAVHLILEYQKGQTMGDMVAPRANRFILVHDPLNARLAGLETLSAAVADGDAGSLDAFVASGLNQLEALAPAEREARLRDVRSALSDLPPTVPIHLELASMADETFAYKMAATLFPLADSFGLNEQELAYLFESLGGLYSDYGTSAEALTGKVPDVHAVTSALEFVLQRADEWSLAAGGDSGDGEAANGIRRISRVHFHCLSYHIIVERNVPGRGQWAEELWRATAQGSAAATNNACGPAAAAASPLDALKRLVHPEYFEEADLELLFDKPCPGERRSGVCLWSSENNEGTTFSLAPVLVCAHPRNTVGLGDAISSTGLAYSLK